MEIDRIYCGICADTLVRRRYYKILAPLGASPLAIARTLQALDPAASLVESHQEKSHLRMMFMTETIETKEVASGGNS